MKDIDINWVRSQLEQKKVYKDVGDSIIALVSIWKDLSHRTEVDSEVLELFSKLAVNTNLIEQPETEIWEPARPGFVRKGDEVRVLSNAFDGELGRIHNGRRGKVVDVRYGDIIINTIDGLQPPLFGSHYPPAKLEKLVAWV